MQFIICQYIALPLAATLLEPYTLVHLILGATSHSHYRENSKLIILARTSQADGMSIGRAKASLLVRKLRMNLLLQIENITTVIASTVGQFFTPEGKIN